MSDLAVDAIVVPAGVEAGAVRRALARARRRDVAMYEGRIGAGPSEALARDLVAAGRHRVVLGTGLCGAARPAFRPGDPLVYGSVRRTDGRAVVLDVPLARDIARRVPGALSGVRAVHVDAVIARAADKAILAERGDALDMETASLAMPLHAAGVRFAVLRVVSDGADGDLPDLSGAIGDDGAVRPVPLALAFARRPLGAVRLTVGSLVALRALERALSSLLRD